MINIDKSWLYISYNTFLNILLWWVVADWWLVFPCLYFLFPLAVACLKPGLPTSTRNSCANVPQRPPFWWETQPTQQFEKCGGLDRPAHFAGAWHAIVHSSSGHFALSRRYYQRHAWWSFSRGMSWEILSFFLVVFCGFFGHYGRVTATTRCGSSSSSKQREEWIPKAYQSCDHSHRLIQGWATVAWVLNTHSAAGCWCCLAVWTFALPDFLYVPYVTHGHSCGSCPFPCCNLQYTACSRINFIWFNLIYV